MGGGSPKNSSGSTLLFLPRMFESVHAVFWLVVDSVDISSWETFVLVLKIELTKDRNDWHFD
ncbi:hypothetical protein DPMN_166122 [Dreissena polymorpha]|uniref:Uncharacterized protein n=1 Tax=Dreissena polymorpha TaxID=45954 RepID=A0A9D4EYE6_DREPO|nr:hypothetical protein DPMN_166122 [Dreissena polymorpha]